MTTSEQNDYEQVHRLVTDLLAEGKVHGEEVSSADPNFKRLADWLNGNPEGQRVYLEYIQETVDLRWLLKESGEPATLANLPGVEEISSKAKSTVAISSRQEQGSENSYRGKTSFKRLSFAVLPAIAASLLIWFSWQNDLKVNHGVVSPPRAQSTESIATFERATNVDWGTSSFRPTISQRLSIGQELSLESGEIELLFDSDVKLIIRGPSRFCLTSANSLLGWQGAFSAVVGEAGKGFTIETPVAQIQDLGTEFGVIVGQHGETDVAVFKGEVDLAYGKDRSLQETSSQRDRLVQGEGLRVRNGGITERLVSFDSRAFPVASWSRGENTPREPLITRVSDNLHDKQSRKYYKIVRSGLREDSLAFVDRLHEWNGIDEQGLPKEWLDGEYVMPFNDDKFIHDLKVSIDFARPAVLYLLVSDTIPTSDWLTSSFEDTGIDVGLDEGPNRFKSHVSIAVGAGVSIDTRFSVWRKTIESPQTVTLGNIETVDYGHDGHNMYGIVAVPLDSI